MLISWASSPSMFSIGPAHLAHAPYPQRSLWGKKCTLLTLTNRSLYCYYVLAISTLYYYYLPTICCDQIDIFFLTYLHMFVSTYMLNILEIRIAGKLGMPFYYLITTTLCFRKISCSTTFCFLSYFAQFWSLSINNRHVCDF